MLYKIKNKISGHEQTITADDWKLLQEKMKGKFRVIEKIPEKGVKGKAPAEVPAELQEGEKKATAKITKGSDKAPQPAKVKGGKK